MIVAYPKKGKDGTPFSCEDWRSVEEELEDEFHDEREWLFEHNLDNSCEGEDLDEDDYERISDSIYDQVNEIPPNEIASRIEGWVFVELEDDEVEERKEGKKRDYDSKMIKLAIANFIE